jgi:aspartate kinase
VATLERMARVSQRIAAMKADGNDIVVVVSAMGDTTDDLLDLAQDIGRDLDLREMDMLLTTGEQQSAAMLALCLLDVGCPAVSLSGWQAGIKTDEQHGKARIIGIEPARIRAELQKGRVVVIAGFQGLSPAGDITTLGRGGSDTTAVALAARLKANRCMIFTDVDGVYTADPRIVAEARKLDSISYEEMLELASLGAVVLQPRAAEFAMLYNVDVEVRSSFNENPGTIIMEVGKMERQRIVSGIAHDKNVARIALFDVPDRPGIASLIFTRLAEEKINVDMVIQSAMRDNINDIAFTIDRNEVPKARSVVSEIVIKIGASGMSCDTDVAKVSIVGAGMQSNPGVAAAMFDALARENINIHMISTSEIKISCIINEEQIDAAVRALHKMFDLGQA